MIRGLKLTYKGGEGPGQFAPPKGTHTTSQIGGIAPDKQFMIHLIKLDFQDAGGNLSYDTMIALKTKNTDLSKDGWRLASEEEVCLGV